MAPPPWHLRDRFPTYPPPVRPVKANPVYEVLQRLEQDEYSGAEPAHVFRQVMRVLDDIAGANNPPEGVPPDYTRLRKGLPLGDIWLVAREMRRGDQMPSLEQMSFLLDYYVDVGVAVPVVEQMNGLYCRTYRRGEADPIELAELIHSLVKSHNTVVFPGRALTVTRFTKILSALAIYHWDKLPLRPIFEYRGSVPYVVSDDEVTKQVEEATRFLVRKNAIIIEPSRLEDDTGQLQLGESR
jgi:hypothetical protein